MTYTGIEFTLYYKQFRVESTWGTRHSCKCYVILCTLYKEFEYVTIINFPWILKDNHLLITAPEKKYYLESYWINTVCSSWRLPACQNTENQSFFRVPAFFSVVLASSLCFFWILVAMNVPGITTHHKSSGGNTPDSSELSWTTELISEWFQGPQGL